MVNRPRLKAKKTKEKCTQKGRTRGKEGVEKKPGPNRLIKKNATQPQKEIKERKQ